MGDVGQRGGVGLRLMFNYMDDERGEPCSSLLPPTFRNPQPGTPGLTVRPSVRSIEWVKEDHTGPINIILR